MSFFTFGNTVDMGTFRTNFGLNTPISMEDIRNNVWPNGTNFRNLGAFANMGVWRYRILTTETTFGRVEMLAPFASGQFVDYTSPWFRSADYTAITIQATPLYGRTFLRWEYQFTGIVFGYSAVNGQPWNQTNYLILRAIFA